MALSDKELREQLRLQEKALIDTHEWWCREMDKYSRILESFNRDETTYPIDVVEDAVQRVNQLLLKSEWEIKEFSKFEKLKEHILFKKLSKRISKREKEK